jgi:hypothetical protein
MRRPPQLPDLGKVTDTQKDELIVSLWETLTAIEETDGASGAAPKRAGFSRRACARWEGGVCRMRSRRSSVEGADVLRGP